jgi:hypothetical protein
MVELGTHLAYRKSECWKLSTYSRARRRSIPTPSPYEPSPSFRRFLDTLPREDIIRVQHVYILRRGMMQKKLTITLDEAVYEGLQKVIGRGRISVTLIGSRALAQLHLDR